MPPTCRAILRVYAVLLLAGIVVASAGAVMPRAAMADPAAKAQAPRAPRKDVSGGLEVVPWFTLAPQDSSLIRKPGPQGGIDMAAREDEPFITVYGRKKVEDLHADRQHDFSAPAWSDIAMPKEIPIGPASSCSSGAYRTIGGQPATGMDLVGGLGGGRC